MLRMSASSMVAEAKARVDKISADAVQSEREQGAVLIDVREDGERREDGWIPGSISACRGMLEFWADPNSDDHRPEFVPGRRLILFCDSGSRSALAADTLQRMGYPRVAYLDGGLTSWQQHELPVERAP
jgi:rhodanese-related sulfurtransferase